MWFSVGTWKYKKKKSEREKEEKGTKGIKLTALCAFLNAVGEAWRTCSAVGKASWQKPDLSKCVSKRFVELKSQVSK